MPVNGKRNAMWFIDMDGIIAEWKAGCDGQLRMPGYFRALKTTVFLPPLREFAAAGGQVYILSNYLTRCLALQDKQEWVDEDFPEVTKDRRLFVPCGIKKVDFVKE